MKLSDEIQKSAGHNYGSLAQKTEANTKRGWAFKVRKLEAVAKAAKRFNDWAMKQDITIETVNQPETDDYIYPLVDALADLEEA